MPSRMPMVNVKWTARSRFSGPVGLFGGGWPGAAADIGGVSPCRRLQLWLQLQRQLQVQRRLQLQRHQML